LFTTQSRCATTDTVVRVRGRLDRSQHGCVITLQHVQKQRAGQFLLRSEEMKEAAVRSPRPATDRRNRRALKTIAIEYGKARSQQILACPSGHDPSLALPCGSLL
jgi:hypothetical protein